MVFQAMAVFKQEEAVLINLGGGNRKEHPGIALHEAAHLIMREQKMSNVKIEFTTMRVAPHSAAKLAISAARATTSFRVSSAYSKRSARPTTTSLPERTCGRRSSPTLLAT